MVTNQAKEIANGNARVESTPEHDAASSMMNRVRQAICGFQGHDTLLHFERGRMSAATPGVMFSPDSRCSRNGGSRSRSIRGLSANRPDEPPHASITRRARRAV
jgi:hypothetical protein